MPRFNRLLVGFLVPILGSALHAQEVAQPPAPATAVRFEIAIEDPNADPADQERGHLILGADGVRLDSNIDESGSPGLSMIYRRKEKGYLILFHELDEAVVYDLEEFQAYTEKYEALQERLWGRLEGGSPEEEALLKLRESRRETARLAAEAQRAGLELRKSDETGELDGHPWIKYQEFQSGVLTREFLVTPWEHLGIGDETTKVFDETTHFAEQKRKITGAVISRPDPFQHFDKFDGYPLVIRQFDGEGTVVFDSRVIAIEQVEDSAGLFENPGYPEEGLADRLRETE